VALDRTVLFQYKPGDSFLHRAPAALKLGLLLACSLAAPVLAPAAPPLASLLALAGLSLLGRAVGAGFGEQAREWRPLVFYLFVLYGIKAAMGLAALGRDAGRVLSSPEALGAFLLPDESFVHMFFILTILVDLSLLFFKTTTSAALGESLIYIEENARKPLVKLSGGRVRGEAEFARTFSVFVSFIPAVFAAWDRASLAWQARGGGNGAKKIASLMPSFLSVCFFCAARKARALEARFF
jgi:energy-coupling factor transporter transmembrane protein EcfT